MSSVRGSVQATSDRFVAPPPGRRVRVRLVRQEPLHPQRHDHRHQDADHEQVHQHRHLQRHHHRPDQSAGDRAHRVAGVVARQNGAPQPLLDVGAVHVHADVPRAVGEAHEEERDHQRRHPDRRADRDAGQRDAEEGGHRGGRAARPPQGDDRSGQRQGEHRARGDRQKHQPEVGGAQVQLVADLRDAGGPAREGEPGADEGDSGGPVGGTQPGTGVRRSEGGGHRYQPIRVPGAPSLPLRGPLSAQQDHADRRQHGCGHPDAGVPRGEVLPQQHARDGHGDEGVDHGERRQGHREAAAGERLLARVLPGQRGGDGGPGGCGGQRREQPLPLQLVQGGGDQHGGHAQRRSRDDRGGERPVPTDRQPGAPRGQHDDGGGEHHCRQQAGRVRPGFRLRGDQEDREAGRRAEGTRHLRQWRGGPVQDGAHGERDHEPAGEDRLDDADRRQAERHHLDQGSRDGRPLAGQPGRSAQPGPPAGGAAGPRPDGGRVHRDRPDGEEGGGGGRQRRPEHVAAHPGGEVDVGEVVRESGVHHTVRLGRRRFRADEPGRATLLAVAYDEELADRVRDLLAAVPDVAEKRMFGGLAFMVGGAMAVSVGGAGLLVRRADGVDEPPGARPAVMGTRQMRGWLAVDAGAATPDDELAAWVRHGLAAAHQAAHQSTHQATHQATGSSATP